jgi:hypothetical protein
MKTNWFHRPRLSNLVASFVASFVECGCWAHGCADKAPDKARDKDGGSFLTPFSIWQLCASGASAPRPPPPDTRPPTPDPRHLTPDT